MIKVSDESGAPIRSAQITILPLPAGLALNLAADLTGTLSVQLPPGSYDVSANYPGFHVATKHIEVREGTEQTIEIVPKVAQGRGYPVRALDPPIERAPAGELTVPCSRRDLTAALQATDPVYNDAAELARRLDGLGLSVRCTLASKMQHIFAGQIGAAFYRTDAGDFEALFLPQTQSFDGLEVVQQQEQGRYLYSFRGTPRSKVHMDGSKASYFIKERNVLFYVSGDDRLAETLRSKLND